MSSRIEDYALIGDCQTAALIGRDGSIDWLCLPWFDSGACFAALLGRPEHGRWQIAPARPPQVRRRYRPGTLVLEPDFETDSGAVRLIDCMPIRRGTPCLVRMVQGLRGQVPMHLELILRFDYGSVVPWVRKTDTGIAGPNMLRVDTEAPMLGEDFTTVADFTVSEGQEVPFVMHWHPSYEPAPPERDCARAIQATQEWWQNWSRQCTYHGEWGDLVSRSLITLKALTYAPTGGMVAAPTTSLPEQLGGVRNWDYRYCWLRDSTFTLYALMNGGYHEEAAAWREWLLRAVAGKPADTQILYGLAGERRLSEREVNWLPGYENSRPVRVGNAASDQFQLDVYGKVIDSMWQCRRNGLPPQEHAWQIELVLLDFLESAWRRPDEGIWEIRGPRQRFTHSKVMAWSAMDRAVKEVERFGMPGRVDQWRRTRDAIHEEVCRLGYNADLNSFVRHYGSRELDASLLMIPLVGFLPVSDPRMQDTIKAIERQLLRDGFVARYATQSGVDGLPVGEGVFLPCTFWLADNLMLLGREREARQTFERLLGLCNDLGLVSEEYDVQHKRLVGNFPQAFSHVALVNSACNLCHECRPAEDRGQR
jgi:GH15 family glucan-1,4-alpha-glucosidase